MKNRIALGIGAAVVACALTASSAVAAGPPRPTAVNGNRVAVAGTGAGVPAQFAWAKNGDMFIAGASESADVKGGIFVIKRGTKKVKRIAGSPKVAFGIAYSRGKIYASTGNRIVAYGGWDGKRFKHRRIVLKANQKRYTQFNGVSIAPNGRIYTGVQFEFDATASKRKYASTVISVKKSGKDVKLIAKGIRNPWQLTFLDGEKQPIGTSLGSDTPEGTDAADFVFKANPGSDFGFPVCEWGPSTMAGCTNFTKPLAIFPSKEPSTSPTGITHRGKKLFVALFDPANSRVISMNRKGQSQKEVLTGFAAPAVGVGVYKGHLYSSDTTGSIYKVKL